MTPNPHIKNAKTAPVRNPGLFFLCAYFFAFFLFSCKSADFSSLSDSFNADSFAENFEWQRIDEGVYLYSSDSKNQYRIVKIDLSNPNIRITASPDNGGWQKAESVKMFAKHTDSLVAINTTPFYALNRLPFSKVKPAGLVIINKNKISEARANYCAFALFSAGGSFYGKIFDTQEECINNSPAPDYAFGGFWVILKNGDILPFKNYRDYRSAAGLADGGKTLFLLAGKNLSFYDCAVILKSAGADNAMEFDGGSSSQMCINRKRMLMKFDRMPASILGIRICANQ